MYMLLSIVLLALRMFKSTVEKALHTISLLTYLTSDSYTVSKNSSTYKTKTVEIIKTVSQTVYIYNLKITK